MEINLGGTRVTILIDRRAIKPLPRISIEQGEYSCVQTAGRFYKWKRVLFAFGLSLLKKNFGNGVVDVQRSGDRNIKRIKKKNSFRSEICCTAINWLSNFCFFMVGEAEEGMGYWPFTVSFHHITFSNTNSTWKEGLLQNRLMLQFLVNTMSVKTNSPFCSSLLTKRKRWRTSWKMRMMLTSTARRGSAEKRN